MRLVTRKLPTTAAKARKSIFPKTLLPAGKKEGFFISGAPVRAPAAPPPTRIQEGVGTSRGEERQAPPIVRGSAQAYPRKAADSRAGGASWEPLRRSRHVSRERVPMALE